MKACVRATIAIIWIGGCTAASATDLMLKNPPPDYELTPAALWTGWYVGAHAGGIRGSTEITDTYDYYGDPVAKTRVDGRGFIGGAQIGYNIQRGTLLYGFEADIGKLDISGSKFSTLQQNEFDSKHKITKWGLDSTYSVSSGLYGDLTMRLGTTPTPNSLFYMKGGPAFLNMDYSAHYVGKTGSKGTGTTSFDFSHGDTMWGWTIGAGVEYALSPALSLKAEYQHFDFGQASFHDYKKNGTGSGVPYLDSKVNIDPGADTVMVGLNYRLGGHDSSR